MHCLSREKKKGAIEIVKLKTRVAHLDENPAGTADDTLMGLVPIFVHLVHNGTGGGVPRSHRLLVRLVRVAAAVRAVVRSHVHKALEQQHAQAVITCEWSEGVCDVLLVALHVLGQWLEETEIRPRGLFRIEAV